MQIITGSLVALVTPMRADGSLDFGRLDRLITFHLEQGTAALVMLGSTGEAATLELEEKRRVIAAAVNRAEGRIPVVAGVGANSTAEAVRLTRMAREEGAAAGLSVVPYYVKPTQEGMFRHFSTVAEAVDLPFYLYNIPSRTGADMSNDTIVRLAALPNIIGLKDATAHMGRASELVRRVPPRFALYAGDDESALPFMLLGGHGVISVAANVAPRLVSELSTLALAGRTAEARALNDRLLPLYKALAAETNPIPVKHALKEMGLIERGIRLPLTELDERYHALITAALAKNV